VYHLTIFKNTFDNQTHKTTFCEDLNFFVRLLEDASKIPGEKGGRKSSPLLSMAVYKKDTTRSNDNVEKWSRWVAVDVDDFEVDDAYKLDRENWIKDKISSLVGDRYWICYSTASSRLDQPKFRIIFPLTDEVERDQITHFWYALNTEIEGLADKQTKDLSRMFYIPAIYPNAYNFFYVNKSDKYINPDELMAKHPFKEREGKTFLERLPESVRNEVIEYRKSQLNNTTVDWTSYHDCPFFPKTLANEYRTITSTGWYHKMYQIMIAIAGNAIKREYPITSIEIADLCGQFDRETGNWYENRPLVREADRALEWVYKNG
jgi:hypothetical protein|tara:strand:+ start:468 stop:1424 length:957 start_codon:yes stop_codon:yes gene_type:complete